MRWQPLPPQPLTKSTTQREPGKQQLARKAWKTAAAELAEKHTEYEKLKTALLIGHRVVLTLSGGDGAERGMKLIYETVA